MTDFWTMERIDHLFSMARDGKSFGQIAAHIGCSRNAAIGKYQRVRVARGEYMPKQRPRNQVTLANGETPRRKPQLAARCDMPKPLAFVWKPSGPGVGIVEVTGCRYATGDDASVYGGFVFCNDPVDGKSLYCAHHAAIAYTKPPPGNKQKKYRTIPTSLLRMGSR
jgi:hypothetical protein